MALSKPKAKKKAPGKQMKKAAKPSVAKALMPPGMGKPY